MLDKIFFILTVIFSTQITRFAPVLVSVRLLEGKRLSLFIHGTLPFVFGYLAFTSLGENELILKIKISLIIAAIIIYTISEKILFSVFISSVIYIFIINYWGIQ